MNNIEWGDKLRAKVIDKLKNRRGIRLPHNNNIAFGGDEKCLEVTLHESALRASNMQNNDSAFEAWILAIISWCDVQKVNIHHELSREKVYKKEGHYQRALYRLERFSELMQGKVRIDKIIFSDSKTRTSAHPTINVALGKDTSSNTSSAGSESEIEKDFTRNGTPRRLLMEKFDLQELDRQFPVGLFDGEPAKGREIFTGGKSAIDLIGIDRNKDIWIFELKKPGNVAIGAISELLFYSEMLKDAQGTHPLFQFSQRLPGSRIKVSPENIRDAKQIHARLLLEDTHPLLSDDVFALLNSAAKSAGWAIDYGRVQLADYWPS